MSTIVTAAQFTQAGGQPATGLTLTDIDLYLTRVHNTTGVDSVVWDGTQHPTEEVDNCGIYIRLYVAADLETYSYFLSGQYTGVVALDSDYAIGSAGISECTCAASMAAIEFTYTLTDSVTGLPIEGAQVWFATDILMGNIVWSGLTDAFGVARDLDGDLPLLDPGTYYIQSQRSGYTFPQDIEVVS